MSQASKNMRKLELIKIARQSRIKWIREGNEKDLRQVSKMAAEELEKLKGEIPISNTIQEVLDLFSDIIDDGEYVDLLSIISLSDLSQIDDFDSSNGIELDNNLDECNFISEGNSDGLYSSFVKKLQHPLAKDIVNSMRQYITKFENTSRNFTDDMKTVPSDGSICKLGQEIFSYIDSICQIMKSNPLWSTETAEMSLVSKTWCEKFVFQKLYPHLIGISTEDRMRDQRLLQRMQSLAFLSPEHLDLTTLSETSYKSIISAAVVELDNMQNACCTSDKLNCLKSCTQAITLELNRHSTGSAKGSQHGTTAGADVFLPVIILALIEQRSPQLYSTVAFLQRFTHPTNLLSELGYLMTYFASAVHFIETADAGALTISPQEFDISMARCREAVLNRSTGLGAGNEKKIAARKAKAQSAHNLQAPKDKLSDKAHQVAVAHKKANLFSIVRNPSLESSSEAVQSIDNLGDHSSDSNSRSSFTHSNAHYNVDLSHHDYLDIITQMKCSITETKTCL